MYVTLDVGSLGKFQRVNELSVMLCCTSRKLIVHYVCHCEKVMICIIVVLRKI